MAAKQQQKDPPLTKGPVPLLGIRDKARMKFLDIIDAMIGAKALVFDSDLDGCLGLVIPATVLSEHGVEEMFHLDQQLVQPQAKNIIYIARANVVNAQLIAEQIKRLTRMNDRHEYAVYFVPRMSCLCEKIFEEEGVKGDTLLGEMPLDFIPFDEDVLSLELETSFRECASEGDQTSLYLIARALMQFQTVLGTIPRILGKGFAADAVKNMCAKMHHELGGNAPPPGTIKRMILIDRGVDMITPLMTQITYEGMVDEILGIKYNSVQVDVRDRAGNVEKQKYMLSSNDQMHFDMRDIPWPKAAPRIRDWVQKLRTDWQNIHQDASNATVSEMKDFASRLTQLGSAEMHSNISEPIVKVMMQEDFKDRLNIERQIIEEGAFEEGYRYLEDLLYQGCDFLIAMRLACLLSITNNGMPKKYLDPLRKTILACYGYENLSFLTSLEIAGLLCIKQDNRNQFPMIRKSLNLALNEEVDEQGMESNQPPRDISHIYWGYAPISIRLVEVSMKQHQSTVFNRPSEVLEADASTVWRGKRLEAINQLPGPSFDITIGESPSGGEGKSLLAMMQETILVVFIGGVTFSEISALRFLSKMSGGRTKFVIATSHLMNGRSFLKAFIDPNVERTTQKAKSMLIE